MSTSDRFLPHFAIKFAKRHRDETIWLPFPDFLLKSTALRGFGGVQLVQRISSAKVKGSHIMDLGELFYMLAMKVSRLKITGKYLQQIRNELDVTRNINHE